MYASQFMDDLKARVMAHPFLKHPFLQQFVAQPLTREQAQRFALLYYPHILRTRLYQACALGVTPDEQINLYSRKFCTMNMVMAIRVAHTWQFIVNAYTP